MENIEIQVYYDNKARKYMYHISSEINKEIDIQGGICEGRTLTDALDTAYNWAREIVTDRKRGYK